MLRFFTLFDFDFGSCDLALFEILFILLYCSMCRQSYTDYEWSANSAANKPSTPFQIFEKEKPKPGTAEAEIEGSSVFFRHRFKTE